MKLKKAQRILLSSSLSVFLVGCGAPNYSPSESHITIEEVESQAPVADQSNIPALVKTSPTAPTFSGKKGSDTYDVVVTGVPVRDLLFALARDSGVNMDIDDDVSGLITMSALDQTLDAILARIARQIDIRVETVGDAILVRADSPYHKQYRIDFLNVARTYTSSSSTSGVGDGGDASVTNTAENDFWVGLEGALSNILEVEYEDSNASGTVAGLAEDSDRAEAAGTVSDAEIKIIGINNFNLSAETGVLLVYAPERLQKEVQSLLDSMLSIAKRQVLLEATIVEVILNNQYTQGIDWSLFNSLASEGLALYQGGVAGGAVAALQTITREFQRSFDTPGFESRAEAEAAIANFFGRPGEHDTVVDQSSEITERVVTPAVAAVAAVPAGTDANGNLIPAVAAVAAVDAVIAYDATAELTLEQLNEEATRQRAGGLRPTVDQGGLFTAAYRGGDLSAAVQLLDTFGDAKVLSSPRISALNYQPALLRVVDQEVYFDIEITDEINEDSGQVISREYEVTENTVDVGFALNVLPQISENGEVILNLKPSVTRILDYRSVPLPASFNVAGGESSNNLVPITRIRELESVIGLRDGEVAVMGGLLEDRTGDQNSSVPGLSRLPGVGALFERKNESTFKTEFVVFIRARVIKNPSINGDYAAYKHLLPDTDFILRDTERTLVPPAQQDSR